jgi:hypothetical protein
MAAFLYLNLILCLTEKMCPFKKGPFRQTMIDSRERDDLVATCVRNGNLKHCVRPENAEGTTTVLNINDYCSMRIVVPCVHDYLYGRS